METPKPPSRINFKNAPKLSEFEADQKFNQRRIQLVPQIEQLISGCELFREGAVGIEFAHTGVSSLVCFIEADHNRYVLKVPLSLSDGGDSEADFLRQWEAVGVSVPHVFENGALGEHAYTIMEYIDAPLLSEVIQNGTAKNAIYTEMGSLLAKMHSAEAIGFGRIVEGTPQHTSLREWLLSADINKRIKAVQENDLLGNEHGPITQVFDNLISYADIFPRSTYCHFDFSPPNILATDPLTVFDPSPMLNIGLIDIGRSMLSMAMEGQTGAAEHLKEGYFSAGMPYNPKSLQAAVILNAYWKLTYAHKKGRSEAIENVRQYLAATRDLL